MHPSVTCPHCKRTISVTPSLIGQCSACVHCSGRIMVHSPNNVQPFIPDQVDLSKEINATQLKGVDGSDMLKRTQAPFEGDGDYNHLIADAIEEDPEADAELSDPNILNRVDTDGIVSEVNRILGEEDDG